MDKVYTSLNGKILKDGNEEQINGDVKSVDYEEGNTLVYTPTSLQLKKQTTNDVGLIVNMISVGVEEDRNITEWVNPTIIIEYPEEIENIIIKKVTSLDDEITIKEIKNETINNKKVIKITTQGATTNGSQISISHSVTMKSSTVESTGELRIFAYNELCDNWYYVYNNTKEVQDIYDINSNGDIAETRKVNIIKLIYSSPTGLYTNTELANFDSQNTIVRGPEVAKVEYGSLTSEATVKLNVYNNYATPVTGMKILGKVPFEGNAYQISGKQLGSNFTTIMTNEGIKLPDSIKDDVKVYYSTQEIVNENLEDSSNGWTTSLTNYDDVKAYLIDLSKITMQAGESLEFSYNVQVPSDLKPGNITYATHAIYFEVNTSSGIVEDSTETNKVGYQVISEQTYNLELTKYRVGTTYPLGKIKFKVSGLGLEETTYTTNSEGKINVSDLFLETEYTIQEVATTSDYILNDNPITFKVIKQDDKMIPVVVNGSFKETAIMENETATVGTMKASIENEPKYQLNVVKQAKGEDTKIEGVKFLIKGQDIEKTYITDSEGTINISNLVPGEEYTLQEISTVSGYVLNDTPVVFKVERINGELKATIVSGEVKEFNIEENSPNSPILTLNIENEKTYDLKIVKEKINTEHKVEGVTFNIFGKNLPETGNVLTTNEQGILILKDLIPGEVYTVKETKAPSNYEISEQSVQIKAIFDENNILQVEAIEGNVESIGVENGKTAVVTIENEVKYSIEITKTKEDTDEKLSGVKFEIQGEDNENTIYETNEYGIATIEELHLGETYTIKETYAKGYYVDEEEKKVTLKRENGILVLESNGNYKTVPALDETGLFPIVKFELENEEIPKYTLELTKIEEDTDITLQGANFKIEGNGRELSNEINYTTSSEGKIIITNLYENEEYTLTETLAPEGYILETEPIKFIANRNEEGKLTFTINSGVLKNDISIEEQETSNPVVKASMENTPLFKLTKINKDTNEPLAGAKFVIQRIDTNDKVIDYAKDVDGNYVGNLENEQYVLQTNEKGVIACALEGGFYKAIEIEAPNGYKFEENEEERTTYFTIEGYEDLKINYIEDLVKFSLNAKDGNKYQGKLVTLERTLDFNDDKSYKNPNDTSFGDYNGDGTIEGIKAELTNTTGIGFFPIKDFYGIFNGKSNEIKNIYINNTSLTYVGLFQKVYGNVSNLGITGTIIGSYYKGGITGENEGIITNCYNFINELGGGIVGGYNEGTITNCYNLGNDLSGGVAKYNRGTITNCYNLGNVSNAGIVAYNIGTITNCYNNGAISGYYHIGGIAADNCSSGKIINCYNIGPISAKVSAGGIVGNNEATITNCYNEGTIATLESNSQIGGIAGNNIGVITNSYNAKEIITSFEDVKIGGIAGYNYDGGIIEKCYNTGAISGNTSVGGIIGENAATITNCYNTGAITSTENYLQAGGITAINYGTVERCYNKGSIVATKYTGGIAGINYEGTIINSYNEGTVTTELLGTAVYHNYAGGITGKNAATITNCYNKNSVTTELYAGGLIAENEGTIMNSYNIADVISTYGSSGGIVNQNYSTGVIKNCYNAGSLIEEDSDIAGIAINNEGIIEKCYYSTGTASVGVKTGTDTTTSMSDTNMKAQSFVNTLNNNQSSITSDIELLLWKKTTTYPTMNIEFEEITVEEINKDEIGVVGGSSTESPIEDKAITVTEITVENEQKTYTNPAKVIVRHYLQGTTTSVADDEIIKGEVGDEYTTTAKELDKYVVVESSMPSNASGNMTSQEIEVIYVYELRESKVIVHHYKDGTEEKLVEDEEKVGKVGESYTTNYKTDIEGYLVVIEKLPDNMNGTYSKDTIEVIYYYSAIPKGQVIVHHYLQDSNYSLVIDDKIEDYVGKQYETHPKDDIEAYEVISELLPTNANGTITEAITEVIYYYKLKQYNITTSVDGGNGSISGENETPYEVVKHGENSGKELKIEPNEGYKTKSVTINGESVFFTEGEKHIVYLDGFKNMTEDKDIIVTFEQIVSAGVTVKYLEYGTDIELLPNEKLTGYVGEEYTTQRKYIENYETIGIEPDNAVGEFVEEEQIVIYYYKKTQGKVIIKYVEQESNIEISERVEFVGESGTSYDTSAYIKDIENYDRLDLVTGVENGQFKKETQEVIYYYSRNHGKVIVKYIEKDTGKEIENQEEVNGNGGDLYDVSDLEKVIDGYVRTLDIPQNKQGTFTKETIQVIYYYELATPIITNNIEKTATTNKLVEENIDNGNGTVTIVNTPVINKENEAITYNITYNVTIQDYIGKATIELVDNLPAEIDVNNSNIEEGIYDSVQKTITWKEDIENINTYTNGMYTKIITKQITIVYENQDVINDLVNTAMGITKVYYPDTHILKPGEERQSKEASAQAKVKQEYNIKFEVTKEWVDNNNAAGKRPASVIIVAKSADVEKGQVELTVANALEDNNNIWQGQIINLPKYDTEGNEIVYTIDEKEVNVGDLQKYTKEIIGNRIINKIKKVVYKVEHYRRTLDLEVEGYNCEEEYFEAIVGDVVTAIPKDYEGFVENTSHSSRIASGTVVEDGSLVLRLYYDRETYSISYVLNGGYATRTLTATYIYGKEFYLSRKVEKIGYEFAGWYNNSGLVGDAITKIELGELGDKVFYAKWIQKDSNTYIVDEDKGQITEVSPLTTVEQFLSNLNIGGNVKVYDLQENEVLGSQLVGTGHIVKVEKDGEIYEYQVAVKGDLDGNGRITVTDLSVINQAVIGRISLEGIVSTAADLDKNGRISVTDLSMINQYITGRITF